MRPETRFTQKRQSAEILRSPAGETPFLTAQSGPAACMKRVALPQERTLCASASAHKSKSLLSYRGMFTLCSPRIGGQSHGA